MLQAECLTIGSWEKSRRINSLFFPPFPELVQGFSQWGDLPVSQCTQLLWLFQACHEADCVLSPCITSHSSLPCVPFLSLNAPGFCHPNKTLILKKKKITFPRIPFFQYIDLQLVTIKQETWKADLKIMSTRLFSHKQLQRQFDIPQQSGCSDTGSLPCRC